MIKGQSSLKTHNLPTLVPGETGNINALYPSEKLNHISVNFHMKIILSLDDCNGEFFQI